MNNTWKIEPEYVGERLDIFLASQLPELTRSAIAKRLKSGAGTVNDKPASVHKFLKKGDCVSFDEKHPARAAKPSPAGSKHADKKTHTFSLKIIQETPSWMVIDKPLGLMVHPDRGEERETLVDLLVKHVPSIIKIGEDPSRPGIMHRLDKEVSGLMVIAKTQDAFDDLKKQFARHSVDKRYLALVHGNLTKDEDDIKFRIARSETEPRMASRPEGQKGGKAAWTHYKVLQRMTGATLCELTILSGRTHQIRAHLHGLGHPVIGDNLYTLKQAKRKLEAPRLMLQSIHLEFLDPTSHEPRTFNLPPDPAFDKVIQELS